MVSFSARAYLTDVYGISAKGGGKVTCPFCSHSTMSIAGNDQLAKCFHPSCGRFINQQSLDGERNPVQAFLWELAALFKRELLAQSQSPDALYSMAWQYLTTERRVHPQVVKESLIGAVPRVWDVQAMVTPYRTKLEELIDKQSVPKNLKARYEHALSNFDVMAEKLEETLSPGNITFIYTGAKSDILSIRFREPYSKRFSWFKPFPRSGVFNPQLEPEEKTKSQPCVMVVEGEVNALTLQSTLVEAGRPYEPCIALGSASAVDWATLKSYPGKWLLFQDADEAGEKLARDMQEHRTFYLLRAPLPDSDLDSFLRGYDTPQKALVALESLLQEAKPKYRFLSTIADEIHSIRQNPTKKKEFEVNQIVSRLVIAEMKDRGTFYKTTLAPYFFDSESSRLSLISKDSRDLLYLLHQLRLNPSESLHGYVLNELTNEAFHHGKPTAVYDLLHYKPDTNTLYWANGNRQILKITVDGIETVLNGTDGLLFLENPKYTPFKQGPFEAGRDYLHDLLLSQVNFNEEGLLSLDEQQTVLRFYFLSLFFPSLMRTKPILCPVAEKGSGKTSLLRRIGQLLMGPGFDVTPLPEKQQDFQVTLANNYFLAFDNVDEKCRWLNDTLAICATGGTIRMRTLYTTREETEIRINAFVALNSRTPNYRRDDVAERLLLLNLTPWGDKKRQEGELNRELNEQRDAFLSWVLSELQQILKALKAVSAKDFRTSFRIADFAAFCYRIAKHQGGEDSIVELFEKLSTLQAQFTLELDPLFECLTLLAERQKIPEWFTAHELHQRLSHIAADEKLTYSVRNPVSLGKIISRIKPSLEPFFDVRMRRGHSNKTYYSFRLKEDNHLNHLNPQPESQDSAE